MYDLVKTILTSPFGSFASVLSIFVAFFFLVYKAGKIVEKYKVLDSLIDSIDKIKEDIHEIKAFMKIYKHKNSGFAEAQSPINLTQKGVEVSEKIQAPRIVNDNWLSINKRIKEKLDGDDNPYSIQEVCFSIGENYSSFASKEEMDMIKNIAFSMGKNLSDFDIIFGIVIRSEYFKKNNINEKDVDLYDPGKKL